MDSHDKSNAIVEVPGGQPLHPIVRAAIAGNADPAQLREFLELQREWERGEAKKAFIEAQVALKRDLPAFIKRDAEVDFKNQAGVRTHYFHTTLSGAMEAISEPLVTHGFTLNWRTGDNGKGKVKVTAVLTHRGGHSEETSMEAEPDAKGGKNGAQAVASTTTMLQRYTALALLGIATRDMKEDHSPVEQSPPAPNTIDSKRNLAAAGWLRKIGVPVAEAEQYLEKKVEAWTSADLDDLKQQFKPQTEEST